MAYKNIDLKAHKKYNICNKECAACKKICNIHNYYKEEEDEVI